MSSAANDSDSGQIREDTQKRRINLRILSPGPLVPESVNIENVPVTATIGEVKSRYSIASPSHPPTNGLRMIFAGRVLADDNASIAVALGDNVVSQFTR